MAPRKARPSGTPGGTGRNGVLPKLKAVYDFMSQHGLDSLELNEPDLHVRMVRRRAATHVPVPVAAGPAAQPAASAPQAPAVAPAAAPAGLTVKAPMMGIFYRAPSPSSPPFAKEGDTVPAGQVVCMIEAMKVFNEIKADFPCAILKVLVENGKPVKSGQDLFLVERR